MAKPNQTNRVWVALLVLGDPDAESAPSLFMKVADTLGGARNLLIDLLADQLDEGTLDTDIIDLIRAARPEGVLGERTWFHTPGDDPLASWGLYEEPVRSQVYQSRGHKEQF